jgi:uncharacterized protein (TIGR00369 family)
MSLARTDAEIEAFFAEVLAAAPHRHFGLALVRSRPGEATLAFVAGEGCLGPSGEVHGGVLSMLSEPAATFALLPLLPHDRVAVTADFHAQFLRPVTPHARVELVGRALRVGRRIAFCEVDARVGDNLCVAARVTKAIVDASPG